jgi:sporulation protein YlmC with PRC-barrel domain
MIHLPINAKVECADGHGGRCTCVIIDPTTWQVTHFVVKENMSPCTELLVSVDRVVETTQDLVRLRCSRSELATMQPFVETEYRELNHPTYVGASSCEGNGGPYVVLATAVMPVKYERIPSGELAVRRDARVKTTDGHVVGRVDEFLLDPTSERITHLVLRKGLLWSQKKLTILVSGIDRLGEETVYLKLDKHAVELLSASPVRQR